jgi:hypothetical protein
MKKTHLNFKMTAVLFTSCLYYILAFTFSMKFYVDKNRECEGGEHVLFCNIYGVVKNSLSKVYEIII